MEGLSKGFGGVHALQDVDLAVLSGQVHAVVGENGAGKSTLMKILVGVHRPDRGTVRVAGRPVSFADPSGARRAGIDIVFQEVELPEDLTVADCIFLGREPARAGFLSQRRMMARSAELLAGLDVDLWPDVPVRRLSVAQKQVVQIARVLGQKVRILILDEPTSSLSDHEVDRLFALLARLRRQGVTILYVSHKLDEIFKLSDWVTVLRDGRHVFTGRTRTVDRQTLVRLMVGQVQDAALHGEGRTVVRLPRNAGIEGGPVVLETIRLSLEGRFADMNVQLRAGAVCGMFGIVGAGRTEVARTIFGLERGTGGIRLRGQPVTFSGPGEAIAAGIGYVPEDRQTCGLILDLAVGQNISLPSLPRLTRAGFISHRREWQLAAGRMERLRVSPPEVDRPARTLSGGNQQKTVIAKWLAVKPKVLILDEPTKGIDVQTKEQVHELIRSLAEQGVAILMISSELDEVLALSDEILVMSRGRVTGRLNASAATRQEVLHLALA